jgi:hypothetical protein
MKKHVPIIFVAFSLLISPLLVFAKDATGNEKIVITTHFNMEIHDDGKLSGHTMMVDLAIVEQDRGGFYVEWNEVFISPVHERNAVILKPFHHSTLERSIKNVTVTKTGFSFVIDLSRQFGGEGRILQIIGKWISGRGLFAKYDVKGVGLWWSEILKESIKREFKSTDKKIVLPYREVF